MRAHYLRIAMLVFLACTPLVGAQNWETVLRRRAEALVLEQSRVGTIRGSVFLQGTSIPVPGVRISIPGRVTAARNIQELEAERENNALTAISDSRGEFIFPGIHGGIHQISAQLQGYFGASQDGDYPAIAMALVEIAGQTVDVRLEMVTSGTISGRVTDSDGKALVDATVKAIRRVYRNALPALAVAATRTTDDRGEFRLYRLPPGEYYVAVTPVLSKSKSMMTTTLFPGVVDLPDALPIAISGGDERAGVDIRVKTVRTAKVSGHVISDFPLGPNPALLTFIPSDAPGISGSVRFPASAAVDDGRFFIENVPPGTYDLFARLPTTGGKTKTWALGRTSIKVYGEDLSDVKVKVDQGVDLKGYVTLDGARAVVAGGFFLEPIDSVSWISDTGFAGAFRQVSRFLPAIARDGSFTIPGVPEGRYRLEVHLRGELLNVVDDVETGTHFLSKNENGWSRSRPVQIGPAGWIDFPPPPLPPGTYVADIRQGGVSVYDAGFGIGSAEPGSVEVVLRSNGGSVEGILVDRAGKPVQRTTVVLVPSQDRRQNPSLYKTAYTNPQGQFLLAGIPPGDYKLFSWKWITGAAYENADFLRRYESRGVAVRVTPGNRQTVNVELID